ncbi:hypothetical protein Acr_00g0012550 [Actinidia rufa]|uniref:Uncharacterized protein n=1 Tax=Actinidia rufa TaxID=165716 RepID=A0A7J0DBG9_9ERIC|nr:hypothetical protein Acr_00g0012550 [Actinidia rufa]
MKLEKQEEAGEIVVDVTERKTNVYTVAKPQWLEAVQKMETKETPQEAPLDIQLSESVSPGLIIRKQKQVEKANVSETKASEQSTSSSAGAEIRAEDAVAMLLKHKRGYYAADDETGLNIEAVPHGNQSGKDNKKPKRMLGPERPSFLGSEMDF